VDDGEGPAAEEKGSIPNLNFRSVEAVKAAIVAESREGTQDMKLKMFIGPDGKDSAILTALLFAAIYIFWTYYPHGMGPAPAVKPS
jgi:hypothetical protein